MQDNKQQDSKQLDSKQLDNKESKRSVKICNYFYLNREQKYAKRYLSMVFAMSQLPAIDKESMMMKVNQLILPEFSYYIYLTELRKLYPAKYKHHLEILDKYNVYGYCNKHFIDRHGESKIQSFINNMLECDAFELTDNDDDYFLGSNKKYAVDEMEVFTFDYAVEVEQCVHAIYNVNKENEKDYYDWMLSKFPVELIEALRDNCFKHCSKALPVIEAVLLRKKGQLESYESFATKYKQDTEKISNDDEYI